MNIAMIAKILKVYQTLKALTGKIPKTFMSNISDKIRGTEYRQLILMVPLTPTTSIWAVGVSIRIFIPSA